MRGNTVSIFLLNGCLKTGIIFLIYLLLCNYCGKFINSILSFEGYLLNIVIITLTSTLNSGGIIDHQLKL